MLDFDFRTCKKCATPAGRPVYKLKNGAVVYVCGACGFHYIDYLDDLRELSAPPRSADEKRRLFTYIETVLEHSRERFVSKVDLVKAHLPLRAARCLDLGAGGGIFLHLLQREGASVHGIEPDRGYALFALENYGLTLSEDLVEHPHWQEQFREFFDVVTLWDVVEHVNFPIETLTAAIALLKPGGILCLDTPIRDALFHRLGEMSYRLSGGRLPSFLNMQYSNRPFAHKQIFASFELRALLEEKGLSIVKLEKQHELSFPYAVYLEHVFKSRTGARLASPAASLFFFLFRIRNKVVLVARKVPHDMRARAASDAS